MIVMHVNFMVFLFAPLFSGIVQGIIKSHEKNIIREEERRGSGSLQNEMKSKPDQDTFASFKRDAWAIGLNPKHQLEDCHHCQPTAYEGGTHEDQGQQGYGLVAPDNMGYPLGGVGKFVTNTRINEPGYVFEHSSGGNGASYGYGGGGLEQGVVGIGNFGYGGSGINHYDGGIGNYGHSGGGIGSYGHSAVGQDYGHSGGGFAGLTGLIHKKISLKKLILPIAAIALLGAAAAMTTNPVLLQLGTISGRKKRSISENIHRYSYPHNPFVRPKRI